MMKILEQVNDFYPKYLKSHENRWNRLCHLFGNVLTLIYLLFCVYEHCWLWSILTPFIIYPFGWMGHLFLEKNEPATWSVNPLITKLCDWKMCWQMIGGQI